MTNLFKNPGMTVIVSRSRDARINYFWSYLVENFSDINSKILVITSFRNLHFNKVIKKINRLEEVLPKIDILWVPSMHLSLSSLFKLIDKKFTNTYEVICFYDFSSYDLLVLSKEKFDFVRVLTLLLIYLNRLSNISDRNIVFTAPISPKQKIWSILGTEIISQWGTKVVFLERIEPNKVK